MRCVASGVPRNPNGSTVLRHKTASPGSTPSCARGRCRSKSCRAWDLLNVLALGNEYVLGNTWSNWRHAEPALDLVTGHNSLPQDEMNCGAGSGIPCHRLQKVEILRRCVVPCTCRILSLSPPAVTGANCESPTKRVCADWRATS